ncbi:hypothetical protein GCM10020218_103440 [Dactylosporangium vinaceum]
MEAHLGRQAGQRLGHLRVDRLACGDELALRRRLCIEVAGPLHRFERPLGVDVAPRQLGGVGDTAGLPARRRVRVVTHRRTVVVGRWRRIVLADLTEEFPQDRRGLPGIAVGQVLQMSAPRPP